MDFSQFVAFALVACFAAYLQAFTGFAFGLVTISAVAVFDLMPVEHAALIVGLLTLVSAGQIALQGEGALLWRPFWIVMMGALGFLPVGYFVLRYLSAHHVLVLSVVLGAVIMVCSFTLIRRIEPAKRTASTRSNLLFGAASGLMTGLLSAGGPPLAYHFYRQSFSLAAIRETLTTVYAINQLVRLGLAALVGALTPHLFLIAGLTIPAVIGGAALAKRFPPPLPITVVRRVVGGLLFLSGVAIAGPAATRLIGV